MKETQKAGVRPYLHAIYQNNRLRFAVTLAGYLIFGASDTVFSILQGEILNVIVLGSLSRLLGLAALLAALLILQFAISSATYYLKCRFVHQGIAQYKGVLFRQLCKKSIAAFQQESTSRYLSLLTNDAGSIEENYLNRTTLIATMGFTIVTSLTAMVLLSWKLTLLSLFLSLIPAAVSAAMSGEMTRREKAVSDQNEHFVANLKDFLTGFAVVKGFKSEDGMIARFDEMNRKTELCKQRRRWWDCLVGAAGDLSSGIFMFGPYLAGALLALNCEIAVGTVVSVVNLCSTVAWSIRDFPGFWASRKAARGLIDKAAQAVEEHAGRSGRHIAPVLRQGIRLSHVSYRYDGSSTEALRDVSLEFEAGKSYAIVGGSGSGKSTLLSLLMGASAQYGGSITIDGQEMRDIDPDSLYDLCSLIGQNVFLFDDTVANNITMFRQFPADAVERAVQRSGLAPLAAERGLNAPCGENGCQLSGGERQRVSIARCLLRGTPVLLLDEATAALDNRTAFAVTQAVLDLDGLTRLVVTHRLDDALLRRYDEIIVLRDGTVCERGRFDQLMRRMGYFYSLYTVSKE
ncbi:ABC transporter ATP-binding protein [uncultured Gemmiger sp.]|uniref:ABC transporter ATP-binding protein n=1 Tax=uncultured Gemmiger sp. TaxID=1623490 RepID=UPI0025CDA84B|nr:ABC transporter ATP-binding protein [uncultured Gemmiger sp.]